MRKAEGTRQKAETRRHALVFALCLLPFAVLGAAAQDPAPTPLPFPDDWLAELRREALTRGISQATELAADGTEPPSDLSAQADYRQHLARVLSRRAVQKAVAAS